MSDELPEAVITAHPDDEPETAHRTEPAARAPLSSADRAAAFATGRAPIDRKAALRAGPVPVPRKFVMWLIAGFAVVGIGGIVAEHFVGNAGVESVISTPPPTLAGAGTSPPTAPAAPSAPPVGASLNAFIGLSRLTGHHAPSVSLHDQRGHSWTLGQARGKVVVLTFFNAECNDICPVLAKEILEADGLLGRNRAHVQFVVVNSDPIETSLRPTPPALTLTGIIGLSNVTFLNGSLTDLNRIWTDYGVTVAVQHTTRIVTHNDIMYFINPNGGMSLRAIPFANEDSLGAYSLAPADIQRFAHGTADSATSLLKGTS